jgi:hypothetical protein
MLSTRRRRRRWRSFCGAESRHGIFLPSHVSGVGLVLVTEDGAHTIADLLIELQWV